MIIHNGKKLMLAKWVSLSDAAACIYGKTPPLESKYEVFSPIRNIKRANDLNEAYTELFYCYLNDRIAFWGFEVKGHWIQGEHCKSYKISSDWSEKFTKLPHWFKFEDFDWDRSRVASHKAVEFFSKPTDDPARLKAYANIKLRSQELTKYYDLGIDDSIDTATVLTPIDIVPEPKKSKLNNVLREIYHECSDGYIKSIKNAAIWKRIKEKQANYPFIISITQQETKWKNFEGDTTRFIKNYRPEEATPYTWL